MIGLEGEKVSFKAFVEDKEEEEEEEEERLTVTSAVKRLTPCQLTVDQLE